MVPKHEGESTKKNKPEESLDVYKKPVRRPKKGPRKACKTGRSKKLSQSGSGLAVREAIREWLLYAKANGYSLVTGKRKFDRDIDFVNTLIEEEKSLYEFCRFKGIGSSENLSALLSGPVTREGFEHRVFYHLEDDPPRVTKITFPGKYGRIEHTPFLYLERLALSNELFPVLDVRLEDCVRANGDKYSVISSMRAFTGPPPTQQEIDDFLTSHGFAMISEPSLTIDYTNKELGINLRDCHPRNWVKAEAGLLIPIDIVPELVV